MRNKQGTNKEHIEKSQGSVRKTYGGKREHSGNHKMIPESNTILKTCVKRSRNCKENEHSQKKRKVEENPVRFDQKSMMVKCKNCDISVSKNAYNQHLDWHFQMNMKNKKMNKDKKK